MPDSNTAPQRLPLRKRVLFRMFAVLLGLSPFVLAEGIVRWTVPAPAERLTPTVEFVDPQPLFERDERAGEYRIPRHRQTYFAEDRFAIEKPADGFRIFCLGGSTVQGRPYSLETSFPTWLEQILQTVAPERSWEVVNCGGISYASYRLIPILEEVLNYEPDLIIIYSGHNEFLEDRTYGHLRTLRERGRFPVRVLQSLRLVQVTQRVLMGERKRPATTIKMPGEVEAILDYERGLEAYEFDPEWRSAVADHYRANLRTMIKRCREQNVELLLCTPARNLRDCPPFKTITDAEGVSPEEAKQITTLREAAEKSPPDADLLLKRALKVTPQHAGIHYQLANVLHRRRDIDAALPHFRSACDHDVCPLRILTGMQDDLRALAAEYEVPLLETDRLFEAWSVDGIPGDPWFVDHVHPSIVGHQRIAMHLFDRLTRSELLPVDPVEDLERKVQPTFDRWMDGLEPVYFSRGLRELNNVRLWAKGRSKRLREASDR